ncbi:protein MIZU-KUSSEI 1 [Amborella trichopoda]|uniref:Protein MIZU-KUSSEI 1 n=1 Tax=Amborella trichopoda TaxID=13333 RepID=W1PVM6_AMBTC|nr:protein MIZU-KUSSEI 1 [Amborella trichopoda]ERN11340.1 hypothetical protein AMTR_s00024p00251250 [Amborella trichopoda]|eukprot:XP_006849759.1 protein MIZU-KUSSEI 1 [Amborella trichopoda]
MAAVVESGSSKRYSDRRSPVEGMGKAIVPASPGRPSVEPAAQEDELPQKPLVFKYDGGGDHKPKKVAHMLRSVLRSVIPFAVVMPFSCKGLHVLPTRPSALLRGSSSHLGSCITGTLFGYRRGHVHFTFQEDPGAWPALVIELAMQTSALVKEMACGVVRVALECERRCQDDKAKKKRGRRLIDEPVWSMYCNGRKSGYAVTRECAGGDWEILKAVQAISMGAGVLPLGHGGGGDGGGELMYMRARFERVVGSKDSEAFYMINPDGTGGPELSIFLLRI